MIALLAGLVLTLTLPVETASECRLDRALVEYVQPDTLDVMVFYRCGGVAVCIERWIERNGVRTGQRRGCLVEGGR